MNLHVVSEKDRKAGLWQGYSGTTCVPDCTHLVIASCTSDEAPFLAPPSARKLPTTTTTLGDIGSTGRGVGYTQIDLEGGVGVTSGRVPAMVPDRASLGP